MIDFREISASRLINIKRMHEYLLTVTSYDTLRYRYSINVICTCNDEMFRRYGQLVH